MQAADTITIAVESRKTIFFMLHHLSVEKTIGPSSSLSSHEMATMTPAVGILSGQVSNPQINNGAMAPLFICRFVRFLRRRCYLLGGGSRAVLSRCGGNRCLRESLEGFG